MSWEAAMRWARVRARETGVRYRVYGYAIQRGDRSLWAYAVGAAR